MLAKPPQNAPLQPPGLASVRDVMTTTAPAASTTSANTATIRIALFMDSSCLLSSTLRPPGRQRPTREFRYDARTRRDLLEQEPDTPPGRRHLALPGRRSARIGRDGRGLPRAGSVAPSRCRTEGPAPRSHEGQ